MKYSINCSKCHHCKLLNVSSDHYVYYSLGYFNCSKAESILLCYTIPFLWEQKHVVQRGATCSAHFIISVNSSKRNASTTLTPRCPKTCMVSSSRESKWSLFSNITQLVNSLKHERIFQLMQFIGLKKVRFTLWFHQMEAFQKHVKIWNWNVLRIPSVPLFVAENTPRLRSISTHVYKHKKSKSSSTFWDAVQAPLLCNE